MTLETIAPLSECRPSACQPWPPDQTGPAGIAAINASYTTPGDTIARAPRAPPPPCGGHSQQPVPAEVRGPGRPDRPWIPIKVLHVVLRPAHRTSIGRRPAGLLRRSSSSCAGRRPARRGSPRASPGRWSGREIAAQVVVVASAPMASTLPAHRPVPGGRGRRDRPLRLVGLGEKEPVPPGGGESGVGALQVLHDREAVHHAPGA